MEEKHIGEDISKNKTNNVKGRNVNNLGFVNLLLLLPLLFDYLQFCQSQIHPKVFSVFKRFISFVKFVKKFSLSVCW